MNILTRENQRSFESTLQILFYVFFAFIQVALAKPKINQKKLINVIWIVYIPSIDILIWNAASNYNIIRLEITKYKT